MKHFSQHSPGYKNIKLGTCSVTLWSHGCLVCSLSMLSGSDPVDTNILFTKKGGYASGCNVISAKAAKLLNLRYDGKKTAKPNHICIAETSYYSWLGLKQHFFVFAPKGTVSVHEDLILDPLDAPNKIGWKQNKYKNKMISYRLFHEKKEEMFGVGKWWSGSYPYEVPTRKDVFSNGLNQFEVYLKKTYKLKG